MKTMLAMKLSAKIRPLLVTGALAASLAPVADTPKYIFHRRRHGHTRGNERTAV